MLTRCKKEIVRNYWVDNCWQN